AHRVSGLLSSWATAGGPHAQHLHNAARNLARSASTKHQPQAPVSKPGWMTDAAQLLAQAADGGKGTMSQMIMMRQVLKTVDMIATIHDATKEARRSHALRTSVENELATVQAAIPPADAAVGTERGNMLSRAFDHPPEAAVTQAPKPMPSAIPKRSTPTSQPDRHREEFSR